MKLFLPVVLGLIFLFTQSCSNQGKDREYEVKLLYSNDFENVSLPSYDSVIKDTKHSGSASLRLDTKHIYSPVYLEEYDQFQTNPAGYISFSAWVYLTVIDTNELKKINLVVTSIHEDRLYKYRYLSLAEIPDLGAGKWTKVSMDYFPPQETLPGDKLKALIVYEGSGFMLVDDIRIELNTTKKN